MFHNEVTIFANMAVWSGFSDAEIRRMRADLNNDGNGATDKISGKAMAKPVTNMSGKHKLSHPKKKSSEVNMNNSADIEQISLAMRLSPNEKCRLLSESPEKQIPPVNCDETPDDNSATKERTEEPDGMDFKFLDEKEYIDLEMKSIEEYQKKQQVIEEHNKKKKQMLIDAIEQRRRQASKESTRLKEIQMELSKLDSQLSNDVGILRDKIEHASRDFMEAQKRYEKAEQEFVAAKLDLHNKSEIKQGLTEHLHIIIHQNELRRSRKLAELLNKLDVESSPDTDDVTLSPPQTIMTSVQTLGPTGPANPKKFFFLLESVGVQSKNESDKSPTAEPPCDVTDVAEHDVRTNNDVTGVNDDVKNDVAEPIRAKLEISDTESNTESPSRKSVHFADQQEFVRELSV